MIPESITNPITAITLTSISATSNPKNPPVNASGIVNITINGDNNDWNCATIIKYIKAIANTSININCPIASIFLAIELFGEGGLLYFALTCGISYMLSGYNGLYSSQTILYSKLKAQYINVKTNDHHEGKPHAQPLDKGSLKE